MPNNLDLKTILLIAVWMVFMVALLKWTIDYLNSNDD